MSRERRSRPVDEHRDSGRLDPAHVDAAQARAFVDETGVGREDRQTILDGDATDSLVEGLGILARPEQQAFPWRTSRHPSVVGWSKT